MILYLNKWEIEWLKELLPIKEVQFHGIRFIAIDAGSPYNGVLIKDIKEGKNYV
ncbi:unnamed protein product [marine sediment metagenome]|uniref:Uncharacterized protein n=1 Tax=marine sediment metagenome TaxID=412755 RepID=X1ETB2_9ZZZZ